MKIRRYLGLIIRLFRELQTVAPYTAISNKVVIVNGRYWNGKELWGLSSTNNLFMLELTLHNVECSLIKMPQPYSNNLRWCIITHYDCTQSSFRFQYRLLTITTFFEIAVD